MPPLPPEVLAWPLARGKKYHFFLCHHQGSGGNQCALLKEWLEARGCEVWYDNGQHASDRNLAGMQEGLRQSMCLLLFLSGRNETNQMPDPNGTYEGPFTRWFCHMEMATAGSATCLWSA
jgi:hypothetical protein